MMYQAADFWRVEFVSLNPFFSKNLRLEPLTKPCLVHWTVFLLVNIELYGREDQVGEVLYLELLPKLSFRKS